jgi:hypothetical protein
MSNKILRVKYESCWEVGPQSHKWRLDVICKANGDYEFRYNSVEDGEKISQKGSVTKVELDEIKHRMSVIIIPAFPHSPMGTDGGFIELEVELPAGRAAYRWWSVPPVEWQPLDDLVNYILEVTGVSF